jgi:hypothetical protein
MSDWLPVVITCTDGKTTITPVQAQALRDRGELHDLRSQLTCEQVKQFLIKRVDLGVCDFCAEPLGADGWDFPAADHVLPGGDTSVGSWRACAPCAALVRAGQHDGLAARAADRSGLGTSRSRMRMIHHSFWTHREGPGAPIASDAT